MNTDNLIQGLLLASPMVAVGALTMIAAAMLWPTTKKRNDQ
jgi:hypothetical protein